jgi:hypothetical protein
MKFLSQQDYNTILKINKEYINEVLDISVIVYKIHESLTKTNSYGEAPKKTWREGVSIPCRYHRDQTVTTSEGGTVSVSQRAQFFFLRQECNDRGIYPEPGDIVEFDSSYYEIENTNENQIIVGDVNFNHSIVCECHLSRNTSLHLSPPQV